MLSKSTISLLKSLQQKKFRIEHGLFLVEGHKSVIDFAHSAYQIVTIYHTNGIDPKLLKLSGKINFSEISLTDLEKISSLRSPQDIIALIKMPEWPVLKAEELKGKFAIALDGIQDPGNMGTIIRTADWFGIQHIICSDDTVDVYNPKVVQATMGSLAHVNVYYVDLAKFLGSINLPLFGALLDGSNIYKTDFGSEGLVVMGNEGNGLRPEIIKLVQKAVTIPSNGNAESLNVSIATAIFCSEIKRNSFK
jgi:TrmH family RNA methyltransferase